MIAVYHWEQGSQYALYVIDVIDSDTETLLKACKDQGYPIPDDGDEVVFLQDNKIVDQRFI
jgi:hypothetical protein